MISAVWFVGVLHKNIHQWGGNGVNRNFKAALHICKASKDDEVNCSLFRPSYYEKNRCLYKADINIKNERIGVSGCDGIVRVCLTDLLNDLGM